MKNQDNVFIQWYFLLTKFVLEKDKSLKNYYICLHILGGNAKGFKTCKEGSSLKYLALKPDFVWILLAVNREIKQWTLIFLFIFFFFPG